MKLKIGVIIRPSLLVLMFSLFVGVAGVLAAELSETKTRLSSKTGLYFSATPSKEDIGRARVFEEPLIPVGGEPTASENTDLAAALVGYTQRRGPDDFASLTEFRDRHPKSPWCAALLTGLGMEYYNTAHYSRALQAWSEAWTLAKDATDPKGKALGDRTAGELAYMYSRLGRTEELAALLKSVENREFIGPATEKISGAREGLWNMQNRPEISFRCGPLALHRITRLSGAQGEVDMAIFNSASTSRGFSLSQVAELSKKVGLNYQMAFRGPFTPSLSSSNVDRMSVGRERGDLVVPSVVHWKVGHYAAMVRREGDKYLLEDPTFGNTVWATRAALDAETSGYFLIPSGALPDGWRAVDRKEGDTIWGKGITSNNDDKNTTPRDPKTSPCAGGGRGMAVSSVHLMLVNLNLVDTPVGYSPPVGPDASFTVRYSHREAYQPGMFTYSNFGPKWTCDWISYITDNPQNTLADVSFYVRGGGTRTFAGFNTNSQTYSHQQYEQTRLRRVSPANYEMLDRSGSKLIFSRSDGSIGTSRKVFLTQIVDPFGNTATLTYDSSLRLTNITDAIGQSTTLTYANTNDAYKITKVTDPFGRFASFDYDSSGRLTNITDVIGITSRFAYEGASDFINALTTPYGITSFTRGSSGTTRWLETLYPDGSKERVEFNQSSTLGVPFSDPAASVPAGMATFNQWLYARNTFYWSRTACAQAYGDYSKAKVYHWLHNLDLSTTSGILESTKEPLEGRVWYDYAGQSSQLYVGSTDQPHHVGRVLDDGSTQLYTYGYNAFGNVTNTVDPLGRTFSFLYDTNGIDLLEVRMTRAGQNQLLYKATYNAQHHPLTTAGPDGQTTTNTYNARGQVLASSNPLGQTTAYTYDTNGYLIAVDGPLPGTNDTLTATYDAFGRILTKTDADGYALTFDHDALDRITNITFPDATFYQITYDRLDQSMVQDRAGRQTLLEYTPMGQLARRIDPLGRVTQFQWCNCGAIKSLTDPMGRTTEWQMDVQGRLLAKQFGDGSRVSYSYEIASGRLCQVVDQKVQVKQFAYNRDNTLRSISYLNAAVPTPTVTYAYDPDYLRRTEMTDGTGLTTYSFFSITTNQFLGAGMLSSVDGPLSNDKIAYDYDELGRLVSTSLNGKGTLKTFDQAGRVIVETNTLGTFTHAYTDLLNEIQSIAHPNGLTRTNTFGDEMQDHALQQISYRVNGALVSQFDYLLDIPAGRIARWSQQIGLSNPDEFTFGYDAANQLTAMMITNSGTSVGALAYSYDLAGNRLAEVTGNGTNVAAYNALNQLVTTSLSLDTRTNEWDGEDRLSAVINGNARTEFTYDGEHRLVAVRHWTNGIEASHRRFLWNRDRICEERDSVGTVTKRFFEQGVQFVTGPNAGSYYYTRDHLDSVREMIDGSGSIRARYAYDPFGRRSLLAGDLNADFGFARLLLIPEADVALALHRAYSPETGRWLSRDPLEDAELEEGPNLYSYVRSDPINAVDPSGMFMDVRCCRKYLEQGREVLEKVEKECREEQGRFIPGGCPKFGEYLSMFLETSNPQSAIRSAQQQCDLAAAVLGEHCYFRISTVSVPYSREYHDCVERKERAARKNRQAELDKKTKRKR
jgi:RHS repeat-associated protein